MCLPVKLGLGLGWKNVWFTILFCPHQVISKIGGMLRWESSAVAQVDQTQEDWKAPGEKGVLDALPDYATSLKNDTWKTERVPCASFWYQFQASLFETRM